MHPAFIWYWKLRHEAAGEACGDSAYGACGPLPGAGRAWRRERRERRERPGIALGGRHHGEDVVFGAGGLGVRRPLRYLTWKLDLSEEQVATVAKILERLKIEQAQAGVDLRRAASELAEAMEENEFGRARAEAAREQRLGAAGRVQEAVSATLESLHGMLDAEQRAELATLIRTGSIRL